MRDGSGFGFGFGVVSCETVGRMPDEMREREKRVCTYDAVQQQNNKASHGAFLKFESSRHSIFHSLYLSFVRDKHMSQRQRCHTSATPTNGELNQRLGS